MLIDSHAHLSVADYDAARDEVLERSRLEGLVALVEIGAVDGFLGNARALELAQRHADVWAAVGLHPHDAKDFTGADWERLREQARHPRVVAIGETGFDFHYTHSTRPEQERAFLAHVELARELSLPLVIHDREAHEETFDLLVRSRAFSGPGGSN